MGRMMMAISVTIDSTDVLYHTFPIGMHFPSSDLSQLLAIGLKHSC
jgi:hypothetical protein